MIQENDIQPVAPAQSMVELSEAELAFVVGGVQKVREAASVDPSPMTASVD